MTTHRPRIHLVNPLDRLGGSELRTIGLYQELRGRAEVHLWTEEEPAPEFAALPIQRIEVDRGLQPQGGTLVLVGVYFFPLSSWLARSAAERVIIIYNTFSVPKLVGLVRQLQEAGLPRPEIVYASALIQRSIEDPAALGIPATRTEIHEGSAFVRAQLEEPGSVHSSPIDIAAFAAAGRPVSREPGAPFVVGRLSRDTPDKFHPNDPEFFRLLVGKGFRLRLMGATCLAEPLAGAAGIEILPAGAEPAPQFLSSLDAFFYRTAPARWLESMGRVIIEAMAAGLPCVCERRGGHVDLIEDGKNGYLVGNEREAFEAFVRLRKDPALREQVGGAARRTVEALYSPERMRACYDFYLRPAR